MDMCAHSPDSKIIVFDHLVAKTGRWSVPDSKSKLLQVRKVPADLQAKLFVPWILRLPTVGRFLGWRILLRGLSIEKPTAPTTYIALL